MKYMNRYTVALMFLLQGAASGTKTTLPAAGVGESSAPDASDFGMGQYSSDSSTTTTAAAAAATKEEEEVLETLMDEEEFGQHLRRRAQTVKVTDGSATVTFQGNAKTFGAASADADEPGVLEAVVKDVKKPCRSSYAYNLDNQGCSFEKLEAAMQKTINSSSWCRKAGRTALEDLKILIPIFHEPTTTDDEVKAYVNNLCQEAVATKTEAGFSYEEMTEGNTGYVKELYDGGTIYNEGLEGIDRIGAKTDDLAETLGVRINYLNGRARNSIFEWPGLLPGETATEDNPSIDNFDNCKYNAAYCCWTQDRQAGDNNGDCATPYHKKCQDADPGDNTDVCYVDMARNPTSARVAQGTAFFPDDTEGAVHCHGLAWANDEYDHSSLLKGNNLFYVSLYDHLKQRGYVKSLPGAPMCGCSEKMPVVSRSDCSQVNRRRIRFRFDLNTKGLKVGLTLIDVRYGACQGIDANGNDDDNDLESYVRQMIKDGKMTDAQLTGLKTSLVGDNGCAKAITEKEKAVLGTDA